MPIYLVRAPRFSQDLVALAETSARTDGEPPFSDQAAPSSRARRWSGRAVATDGEDLVGSRRGDAPASTPPPRSPWSSPVDPEHRNRGVATAIAAEPRGRGMTAVGGRRTVTSPRAGSPSCTDSPRRVTCCSSSARSPAPRTCPSQASLPEGVETGAFEVGRDEQSWLRSTRASPSTPSRPV
ncbi:hypothetical protein QJS66_20075 [Kocuria rhizophila]|nr:hypothetical protein QJS66_20075 [Kocuria rhizophila]